MVLDPKQSDALLAQELQRMSFEDRERVQEEIHGIRSLAPSETHQKRQESIRRFKYEIHDRLNQFEKRLQHQHSRNSSRTQHDNDNGDDGNNEDGRLKDRLIDLLLATKEHSTDVRARRRYNYIYHDGFVIKFIRAELYDVPKGVDRWMMFLGMLLEYFGLDALERPLTMSKDLNDADRAALHRGTYQILPSRDRFNRRVCCILRSFDKSHDLYNRVSNGHFGVIA